MRSPRTLTGHSPRTAQNGNQSSSPKPGQQVAGRQFERHEVHKKQFDLDAQRQHESAEKIRKGIVWRIHSRFNKSFARMRGRYVENLRWVLDHRAPVAIIFVIFCAVSFCIYPFVGRDFFPTVDAGQFRLHIRMPAGTRVEETAQNFATVEAEVRKVTGADTGLILDNIGEPISVNLAFSDTATVGPSDGEMLVSLKPGHRPTADYMRTLRRVLPEKFPQYTFFFQPGDIVSQILNFGLPAPIDIQIAGPSRNNPQDLSIARRIQSEVSAIPGAADVHLQQIVDYPALDVNVDRTEAAQVGLTQKDASDNLLISLASSGQSAPNFWLNPSNGVVYNVTVQTPQYRIDSIDSILNTPVGYSQSGAPQLLSNLAQISRSSTPAVINHYNIQTVYDIYANNQDRDLGGVTAGIMKDLAPIQKHLPRGSILNVRGQVQSMNDSFTRPRLRTTRRILLVYLLLTVNFQSWLDPLVVVSGAPGALSGILWILFATQTSLSVPSLMGSIMSIGVSTANSVLLITFANERRLEGMSAADAVVAAGYTRLRPILMTAAAMVIGMIPMALGLGEGGEQNAPLGRAVIGGLIVATFTTLFLVPISYTLLRAKQDEPIDDADLYIDEVEERKQEQDKGGSNGGQQNGNKPGGNGYHKDGADERAGVGQTGSQRGTATA